MCGICGIIDSSGRFSKASRKETVLKMNQALRHRGPDETGFFEGPDSTLAMSRLSIIDLSNGQQPVFNEDQSVAVVFNGEIYNFQELRAALIERGHRFYTHSDTEVLVHLYEDFGEEMLPMLRGMFAFCLYDKKKERFLIARDRFGEKPLFYFYRNGYFAFSSELGSLLEDRRLPRVLNTTVLPCYLSNTFVPEPHTLIKDVFVLPAGHQLSFHGGRISTRSFFLPAYQVDRGLKTEADCKDLLAPILRQAVKRQLVSDVPLGAFLSGGIDSSSIVALMQQQSGPPVRTYTVRFEDAKYDESPIARQVARHLGTDHHEITIRNQAFDEDIFWKIIRHIGLPFPDSSAIPTYFITREISKHVKVALSGDGGDELFAGYPFHQWWQKVAQVQEVPRIFRNLGGNLLQHFPMLQRNATLRQVQRALAAAGGSDTEIGARMQILFSRSEVKELCPDLPFRCDELYRFPPEADRWSPLQKSMYFRLKFNLPLDMLTKIDRMSMANSLEVRAPFLDPDLFEAAASIPTDFLVRNGQGKYILRQLMREHLPAEVFQHPKTGFSIPLHHYMNDQFKGLVDDLILENESMQHLFPRKALIEISRRGQQQKTDGQMTVYRSSHQLWSLLQLSGWIKFFEVGLA